MDVPIPTLEPPNDSDPEINSVQNNKNRMRIFDKIKLLKNSTSIMELFTKTGLNISVHVQNEQNQSSELTYFPQNKLQEYTLRITNLEAFDQHLTALQEIIHKEALRNPASWIALQKIESTIWYNATPEDLLEPVQFLQRIKNEWETTSPLDNLKNNWRSIEVDGNTLFTQIHEPGFAYESNTDLMIAVRQVSDQDNNNLPSSEEHVQSVRIGRPSKKTAIVYAVQMPLIEHTSLHSLNLRYEYALQKAESFYSLFHDSVNQSFIELLPPIPDTDDWSNLKGAAFCLAYYDHIQSLAKGDSVEKWADKNKPSSPVQQNLFLNLFTDLEEVVTELRNPKRERIQAQFSKRNMNIKQMEKMFSDVKFKDAPASAVFSTIWSTLLLHADGVSEIRIPLLYPFRQHLSQTEATIDERIFTQMISIWKRISEIIEGIHVQDTVSSDYLVVHLEKTLTSKTEFFQKLQQKTQELYASISV